MTRVRIQLPNKAMMQMTFRNQSMTMAHLLQRVRRYCHHVESHEALFLLLDTDGQESVPMMSMRLAQLADNQTVKILKESSFGCFYEEGVVEESFKYEYSYIVPCQCSPRVKQIHGPLYDSQGTKYKLDLWVRIDIFSCGAQRRKMATTRCTTCKPQLKAWMLGMFARTNLM